MEKQTNTAMHRGLMAVRAESTAPTNADVKALVDGMGEAFAQFKARHTERIDQLQREIEDAHVKIAAAQNVAPTVRGETMGDAAGMQFPALRTPAEIRAHYRVSGDPAEQPRGVADFLRAVAGMKGATTGALRALSEGQNTAGGYAVPDLVQREILAALAPRSTLMLAGAGITPMDPGKSLTVAVVDQLPAAAWRNESAALASSEPVFRGVKAIPKSLSFIFKVSRELLADSVNMEAALRTAIGQAFAAELDRTGLLGTGVDPQPKGILNTSGVQQVASGTNGTALGTLKFSGVLDGFEKILAANAPVPTAVIASPRTIVGFGKLADSTGQPLRRPPLLENMQFLASSQIPNNLTVGSSSDCSLAFVGDFRNLTFILRENVSVQVLREVFAGTGEIGFACHVRADIALPYPQALAVVAGIRA